jgi:hypothetical protein
MKTKARDAGAPGRRCGPHRADAAQRKDRLTAALRENLKRRKAQGRARRAEGDGGQEPTSPERIRAP